MPSGGKFPHTFFCTKEGKSEHGGHAIARSAPASIRAPAYLSWFQYQRIEVSQECNRHWTEADQCLHWNTSPPPPTFSTKITQIHLFCGGEKEGRIILHKLSCIASIKASGRFLFVILNKGFPVTHGLYDRLADAFKKKPGPLRLTGDFSFSTHFGLQYISPGPFCMSG